MFQHKHSAKNVVGIILDLQNVRIGQSAIRITVPSSEGVRTIYAEAESIVALPHGHQASIVTIRHALVVSLHLLYPFQAFCQYELTTILIDFRRLGYHEWALGFYLHVKKAFDNLGLYHNLQAAEQMLILVYAENLEQFLAFYEAPTQGPTDLKYIEPQIFTCTTLLFKSCLLVLENDALQAKTAVVLLRLLKVLLRFNIIATPETMILMRYIQEALHAKPLSDKMSMKLKVISSD